MMLALMLAVTDAQAVEVFHCYASSYASDTTAKLLADPRVTGVTDYDCASSTPTLDELAGHDVVFFYSDSTFADGVGLGNVLADWVDGGGGVVEAIFSVADNIKVEGRLLSDGYRAMTTGTQTTCSSGLVSLIGDHPILDGVTSFDGGSSGYCASSAAAELGAARVADWGSGEALVAEHTPSGAGRVVALNFYPPSSDIRDDFWSSSSDGALLMVNALEFAVGGASFTVAGSCPGPMEFSVSGNTPGGEVAILSAVTTGSQVIPAGPCGGVVTGLSSRGLSLRRVLTADADGRVMMSPLIPDGACSGVVQALDVATCTMSNTAGL
jgi:hypothetical protein